MSPISKLNTISDDFSLDLLEEQDFSPQLLDDFNILAQQLEEASPNSKVDLNKLAAILASYAD